MLTSKGLLMLMLVLLFRLVSYLFNPSDFSYTQITLFSFLQRNAFEHFFKIKEMIPTLYILLGCR